MHLKLKLAFFALFGVAGSGLTLLFYSWQQEVELLNSKMGQLLQEEETLESVAKVVESSGSNTRQPPARPRALASADPVIPLGPAPTASLPLARPPARPEVEKLLTTKDRVILYNRLTELFPSGESGDQLLSLFMVGLSLGPTDPLFGRLRMELLEVVAQDSQEVVATLQSVMQQAQASDIYLRNNILKLVSDLPISKEDKYQFYAQSLEREYQLDDNPYAQAEKRLIEQTVDRLVETGQGGEQELREMQLRLIEANSNSPEFQKFILEKFKPILQSAPKTQRTTP